MERIGPCRLSVEDVSENIKSDVEKRAICSSLEELIIRLKHGDFYSPNFDDYVLIGDDYLIHKDDYIAALEEFKFKLKTQGDWVE